ncbi:O-methyltransferase [bacterium]|nr:O-methyltransferase [bacterium]
MHNINSPELTKYLFSLAAKYDDAVLIEMEQYGRANKFPIIDRAVGAMIYTLTKIAGAKTVFELGSGYGYSAYWFAKAMGKEGKVWCTDGSANNKTKAETYLTRANVWDQITFLTGDAVTSLNNTPGNFDIIYDDIDKEGYPAAWQAAKERLKSGGLYICDNTLWSGAVYAPVSDNRPSTKAISEHNKIIYEDKNFDTTLIPLRDGVLIARKK